MKKPELIKYAESLGITETANKTKDKLYELIEIKIVANRNIQAISQTQISPFVNVLTELLQKVKKDTTRKVCKQCNELGHIQTSQTCKINREVNQKLQKQIKEYILAQDCLDDKTIDDYAVILSVKLNISENQVKQLYNEIPVDELLNRPLDINKYFEQINANSAQNINCVDCNKKLYNSHTNSNRHWKGNELCDLCWSKYSDTRTKLWEEIQKHKPVICEICGDTKVCNEQRFNYDHINMFDKSDSICSMVNDCVELPQILAEIEKCQILCISCHHKITDLESRLGFTRIKKNLTRQYNSNDITPDEYIAAKNKYDKIYSAKMTELYEKLKSYTETK